MNSDRVTVIGFLTIQDAALSFFNRMGQHAVLPESVTAPPVVDRSIHFHDTVRDDNLVPRVGPYLLAGVEQRHLAAVMTNVRLTMFKDSKFVAGRAVVSAVKLPFFPYLKFILTGVCILQCGGKYR